MYNYFAKKAHLLRPSRSLFAYVYKKSGIDRNFLVLNGEEFSIASSIFNLFRSKAADLLKKKYAISQ